MNSSKSSTFSFLLSLCPEYLLLQVIKCASRCSSALKIHVGGSHDEFVSVIDVKISFSM